MKSPVTLVALMFLAGCGGGSAESPSAAPPIEPTPTPTPTTPTPTTPTPPAPTPASYMKFSDIYIFRLGAGVSLPSACSAFTFEGALPGVLAATPFGQGLSFRFVITPQVWAIGGDVSITFDGRDGDPAVNGKEVALAKTIGSDTVRFSITRLDAGGTGLDYARSALVSAPVRGVGRMYQCVIGIPTLVADLAASPSGDFRRNVVLATAYVRDGSAARVYTLDRSVVAISANLTARQVAISLRLTGTPMDAAAPGIELGTFTASAPIDPATGNFVASLTGDRAITGTISGRFFGPDAVEIGAALSGSVPETGAAPGFSFSGTVYGAR